MPPHEISNFVFFSIIFGRNSYLKIGYFMVWDTSSRFFDAQSISRTKIPPILGLMSLLEKKCSPTNYQMKIFLEHLVEVLDEFINLWSDTRTVFVYLELFFKNTNKNIGKRD